MTSAESQASMTGCPILPEAAAAHRYVESIRQEEGDGESPGEKAVRMEGGRKGKSRCLPCSGFAFPSAQTLPL